MKFMLLPNDYNRLKILGNGIMGRFEKKFNMLTACDPRVACFALFPLGGQYEQDGWIQMLTMLVLSDLLRAFY
jgi:hypothetical protein